MGLVSFLKQAYFQLNPKCFLFSVDIQINASLNGISGIYIVLYSFSLPAMPLDSSNTAYWVICHFKAKSFSSIICVKLSLDHWNSFGNIGCCEREEEDSILMYPPKAISCICEEIALVRKVYYIRFLRENPFLFYSLLLWCDLLELNWLCFINISHKE